MHFSKVFALLSLAAVATSLPSANPNNPSTGPNFQCSSSLGSQLQCCRTRTTLKDAKSVTPKLDSSLTSSSSGSGLLGGLLGGLLQSPNIPILDNLFAEIPVFLGCTALVGSCNAHTTCCNFQPQVNDDHSSGLGLLGNLNLIKLGNVNICNLDLLG